MCKALRDHGVTAPIDVHLMVDPVDRIIGDFIDAGASYITFHPEASNHIDRSLQLIRDVRRRRPTSPAPALLPLPGSVLLTATRAVLDRVAARRVSSSTRGPRSTTARWASARCARAVQHPSEALCGASCSCGGAAAIGGR